MNKEKINLKKSKIEPDTTINVSKVNTAYNLLLSPAFATFALFAVSFSYAAGYFNAFGIEVPSDNFRVYFLFLDSLLDLNASKVELFKINYLDILILAAIILGIELLDIKISKCLKKWINESGKKQQHQKLGWLKYFRMALTALTTACALYLPYIFLKLSNSGLLTFVLCLCIFVVLLIHIYSVEKKEIINVFKFEVIIFVIAIIIIAFRGVGRLDAHENIKNGFKKYSMICSYKKPERTEVRCNHLIFTSNDTYYVVKFEGKDKEKQVREKIKMESKNSFHVELLTKNDFYYEIIPPDYK